MEGPGPPGETSQIYTGLRLRVGMANLATCACGWTIISPIGPEDVQKHLHIHLHDTHPGTKVSDGELRTMIKTV